MAQLMGDGEALAGNSVLLIDQDEPLVIFDGYERTGNAGVELPLRATLFLLPVAINLEITRPDWLLELYEHLHPFDLVLRLEDGDVVAVSDDEDGLRRLTVPQSAPPEVTQSC